MHVCRVRQNSAVDYSKKKQAPLWDETNSEVDYAAVKAALEMEAKLEAVAITNAKAKLQKAKLKVEQQKMNGIGTAAGDNFRQETTSFMHSRFKHFSDLARKELQDENLEDPSQIPVHQLWRSVEAIICHYEGASVASRFVDGLQSNVADYCEKHYIDEDDVQVISMLVWSNMVFGGAKREFCSLLNAALRDDYPDSVVQHAVVFSRALSSNLVMRLEEATTRLADATNYKDWPNGPKVPKHLGKSSNKDTTWRGGGMPKKDFDWWLELDKQTSGPKKCRTKMFVASSFTRGVAEDFASRYYDANNPDGSGRVLFRFKFERHSCLHVNYIDRSRYPEEKEFLLPPYTVLELEGVQESLDLDAKPHVITVKVANDNQAESLDLPLIPRI